MPQQPVLAPQTKRNADFLNLARQPQQGILPPPDALSGFAVVHLKPDFDVEKVGNAIAATPTVWNPPYTANNDIDPINSTYPPPEGHPAPPESVLTFASRTADRYSPTTLYANIGIGTQAYRKFFPDRSLPRRIVDFEAMTSPDGKHHFPATGGDLFLHVKSSRYDLILEVIAHLQSVLGNEVAAGGFHDRYCFNSIDGRNQFGFFDATSNAANTANPTLAVGPVCQAYPYAADVYDPANIPPSLQGICGQASLDAKETQAKKGLYVDLGKISTTFIGEEDPEHLNGSYCIVQTYVHDLAKFNMLSIKEQEEVFGRQKQSGAFIEAGDPLDGGINRDYPRAHIVRTHIRITEAGGRADLDPCVQNAPGASLAPLQIDRQAASFGTATGEHGLYFVAYARYCDALKHILERMMGKSVTWPGSAHVADHLLEFTTAETGQFFYMPNLEELTSLARFPISES